MPDLGALLATFERDLDCAHPEANAHGVSIIGYGEVSVAMSLRDAPGKVLKRMPAFVSLDEAERYARVIHRYLGILGSIGVAVIPTETIAVTGHGAYSLYVVQDRVAPENLGQNILKDGTDAALLALVGAVQDSVERFVAFSDASRDGRTLAIDTQISNWAWLPGEGGKDRAVLIDVSTPFMRLNGAEETGLDVYLRGLPRFLRWPFRRLRVVEEYIDDYFEPRLTMLDLLGNFHKEGRPDRIPLVLDCANAWLARQSWKHDSRPIATADIDAYYKSDAGLLELVMKIRRCDRFVVTRILRRPYNYVLPGKIAR